MEKNIVLVVREGLVLRNDNGVATTFNGVSSVESLLVGVKDTLNNIMTNDQGLEKEFTHVYVPSLLGGLLNNLVGLYKRTGKTREGNLIDTNELQLYIEVDKMLKDRSDNVRLVNLKHVRKNDLNMDTLIKRSWSLLDREERKLLSNARAGIAPQNNVAAPQGMSPEMIAMQQQMQQQMVFMQQMMQTMMGGMQQQMPQIQPMMQMPQMQTMGDAGQPQQPQIDNSANLQTEGTALNIDPAKIAEATNQSGIAEYDPEF